MTLRWYSLEVDCKNPASLSRWWADLLGWDIVFEADDEVAVAPGYMLDEALPREQRGPGLVFVPVPEDKQVKNRLHIDLAPGPDDDQEAEVARLEERGARRVNVGQDEDDVTWVVMADPEGNEFCVLRPRE